MYTFQQKQKRLTMMGIVMKMKVMNSFLFWHITPQMTFFMSSGVILGLKMTA